MKVKKFLNEPAQMVDEMIEGFIKANQESIVRIPGTNAIAKKSIDRSKVQVMIGNGSGHEPACIGFVGEDMLSANAYGSLFAAPSADTTYETIKYCNSEKGVCVLISNHAGDVINSRMAIDMAKDEDIACEGVILYDDIASASKEEISERRGTVGTLFNYKITGAYANEGHSLEEVVSMSMKVRDNTRTIAVALKPGTSPITGLPMFEISDDDIEIGMGVHGEAAALTMRMGTSKEIATIMVNMLIEDKPYIRGDELAVIVNGCGQTTMMEQLLFFNDVEKELKLKGINVFKPKIGSFITTQEMGGIALSFCKMDEDMKRCWSAHTDAPYFKA